MRSTWSAGWAWIRLPLHSPTRVSPLLVSWARPRVHLPPARAGLPSAGIRPTRKTSRLLPMTCFERDFRGRCAGRPYFPVPHGQGHESPDDLCWIRRRQATRAGGGDQPARSSCGCRGLRGGMFRFASTSPVSGQESPFLMAGILGTRAVLQWGRWLGAHAGESCGWRDLSDGFLRWRDRMARLSQNHSVVAL